MTQEKKEKKKVYYQVIGSGGDVIRYTHCSNIRIEKNDFYYLYNAENNAMLILKRVGTMLKYYMKKGELVMLCYDKRGKNSIPIPCVMLSGLDEFSYQVNRAFVGKEEQ